MWLFSIQFTINSIISLYLNHNVDSYLVSENHIRSGCVNLLWIWQLRNEATNCSKLCTLLCNHQLGHNLYAIKPHCNSILHESLILIEVRIVDHIAAYCMELNTCRPKTCTQFIKGIFLLTTLIEIVFETLSPSWIVQIIESIGYFERREAGQIQKKDRNYNNENVTRICVSIGDKIAFYHYTSKSIFHISFILVSKICFAN